MSLPFYCPINSSPEFLKGKTLIVPVVSVANAGQLAVDLLIASLNLKRIGVFDASSLIPVVGAREDGEPGFTTPLELYGKDGMDVVVIQQRSPATKASKQEFVDSLLAFIREFKLSAVLLLAGVDLSNRSDAQMSSTIYKLLPKRTPQLESTPLANISNLPTYSFAPAEHMSGTSVPSSSSIPFIPGGGLTRRLLSSLSSPSSFVPKVPTACVLQFVLEGDNRGDAVYLARAVANLLAIEEHVVAWKQPSSWAAGLFGTSHDQSLYG